MPEAMTTPNKAAVSRVSALILTFIVSSLAVRSQAPPKEPPRALIATPLGVTPGKAVRLTVRGLRLDQATEVRCHAPKARARLLAKARAAVPRPEDAPRLGDTQVELELTLPADHPGGTVTISVVTPGGESPPLALLVERGPTVAEKEPNNGFRDAQVVTLPLELNGAIGQAQDVDLFRFDGKAGDRLVAEVFAGRVGSALDPQLTLYDERGGFVAGDDDSAGGSDPRLEIVLPHDGTYFLSLVDANDQGGPLYLYYLSTRLTR